MKLSNTESFKNHKLSFSFYPVTGILILLLFITAGVQTSHAQENDFYLAENGVTIMCPDAGVGDSGTVEDVTYTTCPPD